MDSCDWSNAIRYHTFGTRPDTVQVEYSRANRHLEGLYGDANRQIDRERRFRVYKEAPGFCPASRADTNNSCPVLELAPRASARAPTPACGVGLRRAGRPDVSG